MVVVLPEPATANTRAWKPVGWANNRVLFWGELVHAIHDVIIAWRGEFFTVRHVLHKYTVAHK
jgi:hypothetical protein